MSGAVNPLPSLIRASATDAATISMQRAGRSKWNVDDWNAMCEVQDRLIHRIYGRASDHNEPDWCFIRFSIAEQMEKAGEFTVRSDVKEIMARIDQVLGP